MAAVGIVTVLLSVGFTASTSIASQAGLQSLQVSSLSQVGLCDSSSAQNSGFIALPNKIDAGYFYWFFESRSNPKTDPLVLWLTGGPGGSSLLALLTENGPCSVDATDGSTTKPNPYSWTSNANVIWVDQPVGVGFSYGSLPEDYDYNLADVVDNMHAFLQEWLRVHPSFAAHPFFITGESFAGHYGLAIAASLATRQPSENEVRINLQGVAIGNGWTNPETQVRHQADLIRSNAYDKVLFNKSTLHQYETSVAHVVALAHACNHAKNASACVEATATWKRELVMPLVSVAHVDQHDLRNSVANAVPSALTSDGRPAGMILSSDVVAATAFLNRPDVQQKLHVPPAKARTWQPIATDVNGNFAATTFLNADQYVATLLEHNVRVLMYAGDADLMCNWKGVEAWMVALPWAGQKLFQDSAVRPFVVDGAAVGQVRAASHLTFLRLFNAGHMVPKDQPAVALAMLNRFLRNASLADD